jgi:hypothetical protein
MTPPLPSGPDATFRRTLLWALIIGFAAVSAATMMLVRLQVAGVDYSCFWAGAKTALDAPERLYDFNYITGLQGWPLGPHSPRPYIYPPSALLIFILFALPSYWVGFGLWVAATGGLFAWAGRRIGAPWWLVVLPTVAFVAYCGQITFLIGGLTLAGLSFRKRPILAGVLFGVAAALKPQMLLLLPVALIALRDWKTIIATGVSGAALCLAATAIWGVQPWFDWLAALGRFQHVIFDNPALVADAITPYAALSGHGLNGAWAFLLAPIVIALVWMTFRRDTSLADRSIALLGGALVISPYAMNYELALLAPAVAIYLARRMDAAWLVFVAASLLYIVQWPVLSLLAVFALPLARIVAERRAAGVKLPSLAAALLRLP